MRPPQSDEATMRDLRITFSCWLACLLITSGCNSQGKGRTPDSSEDLASTEVVEADSLPIPIDKVAICIWSPAGLRKEAGRKKYTQDGQTNYITGLEYGEMVEMLGPLDTLRNEGNRVYMLIKLQDGQEGWVDEYLFEKNGKRAVVTQEVEVYRRPDFMTLRNVSLQPGEIVVAMEEKDGWLHVSGREKKKKGWIRLDDNYLSLQNRDVELANYLYKAMQLRSSEERMQRLNDIIQDQRFNGSDLLSLVQERLSQEDTTSQAKELNLNPGRLAKQTTSKLMVTAEAFIHSQPSSRDSIILTELEKGDECIVLSKGIEEIVDNKKDYWYKVQHEGKEGWVFGYYTSLRSNP